MLNLKYLELMETGPWNYLNYAILHARGLSSNMFDVCRYEHAFFVRETDLQAMLDTGKDDAVRLTTDFSVLLCKPDSKGMTKAGWREERLLGTQELERVDDPMKLMDLAPGLSLAYRPVKPLRVRREVQVTGTLREVLRVMFDNNAVPATETDSHYIDHGFYRPDDELTVNLCNYAPTIVDWKIKT